MAALKFKRTTALLLVIIMAVGILSACGGGSGKETTAATSKGGTTETTEPEEKLDVPSDLKYNGYEFYILSAGNVGYDDFSFSEITEVVLNDAQYNRKTAVEDLYDVTISIEIQINKSSTGNGPGYQLINKSVATNENIYDMGLIGGYDVAVLAYSNCLYDINSAKYVNLSKSWWDQNANNDLSIGGIMFFTQGEITASNSEATFVIYYNKGLGEEAKIEDPYKIVKEGKWTIDVLGTLCRAVSEDLNGDDKMDIEDRYGLYVWDDSILGMLAAAGVKCTSVDETGNLVLSLYSQTSESMFSKYAAIAYDTQYAICYQRVPNHQLQTRWVNNQALFWATSTVNTKSMREMETDFGILPYPKLTEEQSRYYSTVAPYNSQFVCIPLIQDDIERTSAIIETLAYYGQKLVTPAVYEKTLVGTYFRDDESSEMLDIIMNNYIYDYGYYLQIGTYNSRIMDLLRTYSYDFTSTYNKYLSQAEKMLTSINKVYETAIERWQTED